MQPPSGVPGVGGAPEAGIEKLAEKAPDAVQGIQSLPGSPQMHPRLPGNVADIVRHPEKIVKLPDGVELPSRDLRKDPEEGIPKEPDKPKSSPPFKTSEDEEK